jgi:hypothetical protein
MITGYIMADADSDQLRRRAGLDLVDGKTQVPLQIVAGIDRERRVVDRRAIVMVGGPSFSYIFS